MMHRTRLGIATAGLVAGSFVLSSPAAAAPGGGVPATASPTSTVTTSQSTAPPALLVQARSGGCVAGHTVADLSISGAVPGAQYALYGTSGYVASDPFTAPGAQFSITVPIGHGYFGLTGDVEARALHQASNQFTIERACTVGTVGPPDPPQSPLRSASTSAARPSTQPTRATPSTAPVRLETHTDVLTNAAPSTSAAVSTEAGTPQLLSPVSVSKRPSHTGQDVLVLLVAILLVGGIVTAAVRLQRGRR